MKLVETSIPDNISENIDYTKIELANSIIQNVQPILDEVLDKKVKSIKELKKTLIEKKLHLVEKKDSLGKMLQSYKRKQKVKKLLERINKLVEAGLVKEGQNKNDMIILLKVIDSLPDDKLNIHLKNTMTILTKRFS